MTSALHSTTVAASAYPDCQLAATVTIRARVSRDFAPYIEVTVQDELSGACPCSGPKTVAMTRDEAHELGRALLATFPGTPVDAA